MSEHWRYDECSVAFYYDGIETDMYKVVDALNISDARIAELEEKRRWIPVGEKPLVDGWFIVLLKNGDIRKDWTFIDCGKYFWWNSGDQVAYYMPYPEVQE